MWSGFAKDLRLIKKHLRRNITRKVKTDFLFNVAGFVLISGLCLSMVLQRDLIKEGFELVSPFRYDNSRSIYFGVYSALKSNDASEQEESTFSTTSTSVRFPDRSTIPLLARGGDVKSK